jgi:hypothetical protein
MNTQIQKQNFTVTTALQYVDPRDGNRPASIKGSNGDRYTISDAGYQQYSQMQGQECELTYYEKPSTNPDYPPFKNLTHLNGLAMPRDPRGAPRAAAAAPQQVGNVVQQLPVAAAVPAVQPQPLASPARPSHSDVPPGICGILKSAIESGISRDEAQAWIALGLGTPVPTSLGQGDDEIPF